MKFTKARRIVLWTMLIGGLCLALAGCSNADQIAATNNLLQATKDLSAAQHQTATEISGVNAQLKTTVAAGTQPGATPSDKAAAYLAAKALTTVGKIEAGNNQFGTYTDLAQRVAQSAADAAAAKDLAAKALAIFQAAHDANQGIPSPYQGPIELITGIGLLILNNHLKDKKNTADKVNTNTTVIAPLIASNDTSVPATPATIAASTQGK